MDRRSFLRSLVGGVAVTAAARTWPFRVFSFPTLIERPSLYIVHPTCPEEWGHLLKAIHLPAIRDQLTRPNVFLLRLPPHRLQPGTLIEHVATLDAGSV